MADETQKLRIMITGGGTGGHVFPAIAIADAVKKLRPDAEFLFVGAEGKMEMERVPKAGYPIVGLRVAGFQRGLSVQAVWRNLSFPWKLLRSSLKAHRIVNQFVPHVVVGTGGYASGPVMRAAQAKGIPTLMQEQNSYAGVTNKLLAAKADRICVAYDHMDRFFPEEKIEFTGNPVRTDILNLDGKRSEALRHFGLDPEKKTIVLLGGSLGARTLNQAMRDNTQFFRENADVQCLWQCGKFYIEEYQNCETAQLPNVKITAFLDRMDLAYAVADAVISRAGALSISELCLVGKPAVLVPSPNVAEDHQTQNALALVEKGAARLVRDADASEKMLPDAELILRNDALAFSLGESIRQLGKPGAADAIAHHVLDLVDTTDVPILDIGIDIPSLITKAPK